MVLGLALEALMLADRAGNVDTDKENHLMNDLCRY